MSDEGLGGLAKRWLKAKAKEVTTSDRHERQRADQEADRTERRLREQAERGVLHTAFPALRRLEEQQEAARQQAEAERQQHRRAELEDRATARVRLSFSGTVAGDWSGALPTRVEIIPAEPQDDDQPDRDPYAAQPELRVDLTPLDESRPVVGGRRFHGWRFAVPGYSGPGTYDLVAIGLARREAGTEPDYLDWDLSFGDDDPFYFYPDAGPATVTIGDGARYVKVSMTLGSSGGDLTASGEIRLDESRHDRGP